MIRFVSRNHSDCYVENRLGETKSGGRRYKDQCKCYVGIQVRDYGCLILVLPVECTKWADLRKIWKVELTGLDYRHDMDGVGDREI